MVIVKIKRKKPYWHSYIHKRIFKQNKNFLACITGSTGSGKSWSALSLGESLDPDFDVRNVCFSFKQFMSLVNEKNKKLKKGSVLIFDEVQVTLSHLTFQSLQARAINYVLQTFRHKNFIMFMTSPHFSLINASARKLFHSRIETININPLKKTCKCKFFLLQVSQDSGKIYRKFLRVVTKEDGVVPIVFENIPKPSQKLIDAYEKKKSEYLRELNLSIQEQIEEFEGKKKRRKELTMQQESIVRRLKNGLLIPQIARELDRSEDLIYSQIRLIKKKGIGIRAEKDGHKVIRYDIQGF